MSDSGMIELSVEDALPVGEALANPPANVRFIGVHAADTRVRQTSVPERYRDHRLLANRYFYTVPTELLDDVCRPQHGESFPVNRSLLGMESTLSRIAGNHDTMAGFWNNMPIDCNLLHSTPVSERTLRRLGQLTDDQIAKFLRTVNKHLSSFVQVACGYAGWLMTNRAFVDELQALLARFDDQIHQWGTAQVGILMPTSLRPGPFNRTGEPGWAEYESAVVEFCGRWRLSGLAGPRIPAPIQPMMSGVLPLGIAGQLMQAGGLFIWPDTFPISARDELRELLVEALQPREAPAHLSGWRSIIDSSNRAKNPIAAFARRFRLQHFWRVLRERHPHAFRRRVNRIERAFAAYFGVQQRTIHQDRVFFGQALGADWDQPSGSEAASDGAH